MPMTEFAANGRAPTAAADTCALAYLLRRKGTDVPPFPAIEGGCVLSTMIDRFAYGFPEPRADQMVTAESIDWRVRR